MRLFAIKTTALVAFMGLATGTQAFAFSWFGNSKTETTAPPSPSVAPPPVKKAEVVSIVFSYGSEKKTWVEKVTKQFNEREMNSNSGGTIVQVKTIADGSMEIIDDILSDSPDVVKPHIASPASRLVMEIGNQKSLEKRKQYMFKDKGKDLVTSPLVIAMWEPMAIALADYVKKKNNDNDRTIGWMDLVDLANDPRGWGVVGHPEWGRFRIAHTHPSSSNSGVMATNAIAYASLQRSFPSIVEMNNVTPQQIQSGKIFDAMKNLASAVVQYSPSTGNLTDVFARSGMYYLNAIVTYESLVKEANRNPRKAPGSPKIVAIYPSEGTFYSDHPVAIVNRPDITPQIEAAANKYIEFLLSNEAQSQAAETGFHPTDASIATLGQFTAEDGLQTDPQFVALDVPNKNFIGAVDAGFRGAKKPAHVALVFDLSGSMQQVPTRIRNARIGGEIFVKGLQEVDAVTLITFRGGGGPTIPKYIENLGTYIMSQSGDRERAIEKIRGFQANGGTPYYDALKMAEDIVRSSKERKPGILAGIVVLTDGGDTTSDLTMAVGGTNVTLSGMQEAGRRFLADHKFMMPTSGRDAITNIPIFNIGYDLDVRNSEDKFLQSNLKAISQESRGDYYDANSSDDRAMARLFEKVRTNF